MLIDWCTATLDTPCYWIQRGYGIRTGHRTSSSSQATS